MVSRRKQTSLPEEQPVRFYKIIALTFLFLTVVLFGAVIFMSSKRAVITIETKASPDNINNDIVVGEKVDNPQIVAMVTTTVVNAVEIFSPTGSKEEPGISTGVVTLHNETASAQPLVATTRLLSPDGVLFRLKKGTNVPANGTVVAEVYADKPGEESDIGPTQFTIPGLPADKQKVVYAKSESPMTGGLKKTGILSQVDLDDAEKRLSSTFDAKIKSDLQTLYGDKQTTYLVSPMEKKSNAKVGDVVTEVTLEAKAKVSVVIYDKTDMKNWVEKTTQTRAVGDTQIFRSSNEEPQVSLKDYNDEKNQATLHVFSAGLATINPASKELEKSLFFGKTKDEVKRYVTSLEHVTAVDVNFRPFWMQTVPHIHDHVQIIVKEVP